MLQDVVSWLLDPSGLTPHGFCLLWKPGLIWATAIANIMIGVSYFTIPAALCLIARRRHDLLFAPVVLLFAAFILLCGTGHWLALLTLWVPAYGLEAAVNVVTALVSVVTAIVLVRLLPGLLASHEALLIDLDRVRANEALLRIARDAADAAARAKSEFLATMSHEIRSPMSGLVGVLDLLRGTTLDAEQVRMAAMVHRSAMGLLAVLNDILDFSKIESGACTIVLEPTNVCELVTHLAQPHRLEAASKSVALKLRLGSAVPDYALIDPLRLRQIINNLLSNAVKFTAAGQIRLQVDVEHDGPAPRLRITVCDSGIGMTAEVLDRLFEPFMQADGSTTRDFGGTGLGLCISRRLAEMLDGTLTVTSLAGSGSAFTLLLPLIPAAAPSVPIIAANQPPRRSLLAGGRVLVADDDPTNRWLSRRQLELLGMSVDVAEHGEMALAMIQATHYDLLLTDCHMPRMDGVALTRAVRAAANPALHELAIIGVTADVTETQHERCRLAGMSDVVIKPLGREKLAALLSRHLPAIEVDVMAAPAALAPAPERPQSPRFDAAIYRDLFAADDAGGAAWLAEFQAGAERLTADLHQLLDVAADAAVPREPLAKTAHLLVGSALSVGATRLGEAARRLEQTAANGDLAMLRARNAVMRDEFIEAKQAIAAFQAAFRSELTT